VGARVSGIGVRDKGAGEALPPPIQIYSGKFIIRALKLGKDLLFYFYFLETTLLFIIKEENFSTNKNILKNIGLNIWADSLCSSKLLCSPMAMKLIYRYLVVS